MIPAAAKTFVDEVFAALYACTSATDVNHLLEDERLKGKRMDTKKYPPLALTLTPEEVETLIEDDWLTEDGSFNSDRLKDCTCGPALKLFYAMAWKQGDLPKLAHIVHGIQQKEPEGALPAKGTVFYQFGAHLADPQKESIIDQHVLRAYGIFKAEKANEKRIKRLRKMGQLNAQWHRELARDYREWIISENGLQSALRQDSGYRYTVDQLLFALGKAVKAR